MKTAEVGKKRKVTYHEPEGIIAYVKELNAGKTPIHDPIYFKGVVDKIEVEACVQFVDTFEENILGFCNNIFTQEGGTHLAGFKTNYSSDQLLCQRAWHFKGQRLQLYRCRYQKRYDSRDRCKAPGSYF